MRYQFSIPNPFGWSLYLTLQFRDPQFPRHHTGLQVMLLRMSNKENSPSRFNEWFFGITSKSNPREPRIGDVYRDRHRDNPLVAKIISFASDEDDQLDFYLMNCLPHSEMPNEDSWNESISEQELFNSFVLVKPGDGKTYAEVKREEWGCDGDDDQYNEDDFPVDRKSPSAVVALSDIILNLGLPDQNAAPQYCDYDPGYCPTLRIGDVLSLNQTMFVIQDFLMPDEKRSYYRVLIKTAGAEYPVLRSQIHEWEVTVKGTGKTLAERREDWEPFAGPPPVSPPLPRIPDKITLDELNHDHSFNIRSTPKRVEFLNLEPQQSDLLLSYHVALRINDEYRMGDSVVRITDFRRVERKNVKYEPAYYFQIQVSQPGDTDQQWILRSQLAGWQNTIPGDGLNIIERLQELDAEKN